MDSGKRDKYDCITYMDEALYENKLSVVFEDLPAARETLGRVREFVQNHPTVYCGTHTPQGYENLEVNRVMDLNNPVPTVLAEVVFSAQEASGKYVCSICGYVYVPAEHDGIAFEDLPDSLVYDRGGHIAASQCLYRDIKCKSY